MPLVKDSVREATAGAFAGAVTKTLSAPLDRLKLVVQLRGSLKDSSKSSAYEGPIKAFTRMIQEEGVLALWRGNVPTILINCGTSGLNFMFMDWYKKAAVVLVGSDQQFLKSFLSAFLAGATANTLLYPMGLMRTKLALDVGKDGKDRLYPRGMRDVVRHSIRVNGFTSLYQGWTVALASVSLYRMVHLGGYDYLKTEMFARHGLSRNNADASKIPFAERFLAAQFVSMMASTIHYPLDSVRRRLMMQSDVKEKKYRSGFHCFVQIYKEEGVPGYFRGLGTNYIRSVGAALLLVSYDFFKTLLL
jgi:solute carrier family 25 (adenine nucleotide translocator) protein 4/5/6/31